MDFRSQERELELFAPPDYWTMPVEALKEIAGGCGAGRGLGDTLVPDTAWGLSIKPACKIHDFMYHFGECLEDKKAADRVFLNNMIRIIEARTRFSFLARLRLQRCRTYFFFVKYLGGPAFWKRKNPDATIGKVAA